MISSIYCRSLQVFLCPNHFHMTQWSRYNSFRRQILIHLQLCFSTLAFFSVVKSVFDTLNLRIWVGLLFFFSKRSYALIYNRTFPQKQSAYSHSVETWESISFRGRGITSLAFTSMCLRVRTLRIGSSWRETDVAKIQTLVYLGITCLSAHVFNFLISGMFSNAFVHKQYDGYYTYVNLKRIYSMKNIFDKMREQLESFRESVSSNPT